MSKLKPHPIPDAALDADVAILGKKGRGKTYVAKGLVERLLQMQRRVLALDPGAITRPGIQKQEAQPHECDQCELVEKQVRYHGNAPAHRCERGALYLAFWARQLSATPGYATRQ